MIGSGDWPARTMFEYAGARCSVNTRTR